MVGGPAPIRTHDQPSTLCNDASRRARDFCGLAKSYHSWKHNVSQSLLRTIITAVALDFGDGNMPTNHQQCCQPIKNGFFLLFLYYIEIGDCCCCCCCCCCSTGSKSTSIPAKSIATLIKTTVAAVALDLGYAVGSQRITRP